VVGGLFAAGLAAPFIVQASLNRIAALQGGATVQAPRFEVDPLWPKPLPNHWLLGSTVGVSVDADDHVWIIHRGATLGNAERGLELKTGECCAAAPPVLEFDQEGNLLRHWGGPGEGYEWPDSVHGLYVDYRGNVWIGGNGAADSHLLKFSKDGKLLMQFGKKGARAQAGAPPPSGQPPAAGGGESAAPTFVGGSLDEVNFGRPAKVFVDPTENEAYVADGYLNRRVAVIDADTGKIKRYWGAYGNRPDDASMPPYDPAAPAPDRQFRNPVHCADMSVDRLIYVCDRLNNRLQVFTPDGKFTKEAIFAKNTKGQGAVWDIAFSRDPQQQYIFFADGVNAKIRVVERQSLRELTAFGDGGRQPGQFYAVHSIAIDSRGNLYTTETFEGKRVQRFLYRGVGAVPSDQGTVWPGTR
jgi:DNA-binding beta-propeller fold protein YncE